MSNVGLIIRPHMRDDQPLPPENILINYSLSTRNALAVLFETGFGRPGMNGVNKEPR
jgi:hypothetical protein